MSQTTEMNEMNTEMNEEKKLNYRRNMTEALVRGLTDMTIFAEGYDRRPVNPATGVAYATGNAAVLNAQGRSDPRWMTIKQANRSGYLVRQGEKPTTVTFWKSEENGKKLAQPKLTFLNVFNAEQFEGMPGFQGVKNLAWNPEERAEGIIAASGIKVKEGGEATKYARYSEKDNTITMPPQSKYESRAHYLSSVLYKLCDAVKIEERTEKEAQDARITGTRAQVVKGLSTALAAHTLTQQIGLPSPVKPGASTLEKWRKEIAEEYTVFFRAAGRAAKVERLMNSLDREYTMTRELDRKNVVGKKDRQHLEAPKDAVYLDLLFEDKDEAKRMGARFDGEKKKWFITPEMDRARFADMEAKFAQKAAEAGERRAQKAAGSGVPEGAVYLDIAYEDKEEAKGLGARFDPEKKQWYVGRDEDLTKFAKLEARFAARVEEEERSQGGKKFQVPADAVHLDILFEDKEEAKGLGAKFDGEKKKWFITPEMDRARFAGLEEKAARRHAELAGEQEQPKARARMDEDSVALNILFEDKDEAKKMGARFDGGQKKWFIEKGVDRNQFAALEARYEQKVAESREKGLGQGRKVQVPEDAVYLDIAYEDREEAKSLGARFDGGQKKWFITPEMDRARFAGLEENCARIQAERKARAEERAASSREYIYVPMEEKDEAKKLGARWDNVERMWYVPEGKDKEAFARWAEKPADWDVSLNPVEEFTQVLKQNGFDVSARSLPNGLVCDGVQHRIALEGDLQKGVKKLNGSYVAHLDGRPNMTAVNYKTGEKLQYIARGQIRRSPEQELEFQRKVEERTAERRAATEAKHEEVAAKANNMFVKCPNATKDAAYLQARGIGLHRGLKSFKPKDGQPMLILPIQNDKEEIRSLQYIHEDGTKKFSTGGEIKGNFHIVDGGGMGRLADSDVVMLAEGYATACSVAESTQKPVVCTLSSQNMVEVAKVMKEKIPNHAFVICADDDRENALEHQVNPGLERAEEAREILGEAAVVAVPEFTDEERAQAHEEGRTLTDFNDLSRLRDGAGRVQDTLANAVEQALDGRERARERAKEQSLAQARGENAKQGQAKTI